MFRWWALRASRVKPSALPTASRLRGISRPVGVLVLVLLCLVLPGAAAVAVEAGEEGGPPTEDAELPSLEEVGSQSEISQEFFPEPAENPPFTAALLYPLLGVAVIAVLVTLFLYLKWQPRFGRERNRR